MVFFFVLCAAAAQQIYWNVQWAAQQSIRAPILVLRIHFCFTLEILLMIVKPKKKDLL